MKNFNFKNKGKQSIEGKILTIICIFLSLFGLLMVFSASYYYAKNILNNKYYYLLKQAIGLILGLICMFFVSKMDYNKLQKFGLLVLIFGYILLVLVFIPGLGVENYGAKRWINLPGFTVQSSEIAKFCFVLFSASYLAKNYKKVKYFKTLLPVIFSGILMCFLIILEPNMSITICVLLVMMFMLFVGGISFKHFLMLAIPALLMIPVLIIIEPYRLERLLAFLNPWANPQDEGYQLIQSFFAISNGGLFGVGLFNSRQKYLFLPFSESDFIFAVIAEEFGLFGIILILLLYFVLIFCGIKIAIKAINRFGCYLSSGITAVIGVQMLINIAVVSGLIPPTGLPLPFISHGSTSIVVFLSAVGVLRSIDRKNQENQFLINNKC
ncbi:MAG: putative lipid II flippase FtsW [Clostridia bacterium]|nr:putative lipid II flippase FtsW [Clostridia bacterium]